MLRGQRRWARCAAIIASAMKYLALPLAETSIPKLHRIRSRTTKYRLPRFLRVESGLRFVVLNVLAQMIPLRKLETSRDVKPA